MKMKKLTFWVVIVNAFFLLKTHAQEIITRPIGDCRLVFADNFDSTALNTRVWKYRTDTRFWSTQMPRNVEVKNGKLYLNVKKETVGTSSYTGGGIITIKGYKYGYYESRFKIPKGKGWHTSFWMMNNTAGTTTYQEIDVCENDSKNQFGYTTNLHNYVPTHSNSGAKSVVTPNLSDTFHVWGCDFSPTVIKFYFEGKLVRTLDATKQKHGDANIWLTTIAAPLGGTDKVDDTLVPSAAIYDYVKYYELINPVYPDTTTTDSMRTVPNSANPQIIIDNTDSSNCTFNSKWSVSAGAPGFYGINYAYPPTNSATYWAKYTPSIPNDGNYRIFMRWTEHANRATAAPVEINHMEGLSKLTVNQTKDGGKWNFIGSYQLNSGNQNYVKISGVSSGTSVADALLFEEQKIETSIQTSSFDSKYLSFLTDGQGRPTHIKLNLSDAGNVTLSLYNAIGKQIAVLLNNKHVYAGSHIIQIPTSGARGLFLLNLKVNGRIVQSKKILL